MVDVETTNVDSIGTVVENCISVLVVSPTVVKEFVETTLVTGAVVVAKGLTVVFGSVSGMRVVSVVVLGSIVVDPSVDLLTVDGISIVVV